MQGIPKPMVLDALSQLMQDPRYFDGNHPEHGRYVAFMKAGFETALAEDDEEKQDGEPHVMQPTRRELIPDIQKLSSGDRVLVIIELLKRGVARQHGIGPNGPVDSRSSDVDPAPQAGEAPGKRRPVKGTFQDAAGQIDDQAKSAAEKMQRDRLIRRAQEDMDKKHRPEPRRGLRSAPSGGPVRPLRPGGTNWRRFILDQ